MSSLTPIHGSPRFRNNYCSLNSIMKSLVGKLVLVDCKELSHPAGRIRVRNLTIQRNQQAWLRLFNCHRDIVCRGELAVAGDRLKHILATGTEARLRLELHRFSV